MTLPKQTEIEAPLLQLIAERGGEARPRDLYGALASRFPQITAADLAETMESGVNRWTNRVQWTRQSLVGKGELDSPRRGFWRITEQGRARLLGHVTENPKPAENLQALWEEYESDFRTQTLDRLLSLSPTQFERFASEFLRAYGFVDNQVTQVSADGGIDGHGRLRVGVATMRVAYQCKKWQGSVGRPEVDKFRGAIQGEFEQGIFFTTSTFSRPAQEASIKKGAVPIILMDGDAIVSIMIEKGVGVARLPLFLFAPKAIPGIDEDSEA